MPPLKVLFLSSDTGGGHRASAESLARQFELLYPGTTYDLHDVMTKDGVPPYNKLVESYKHLSAHPSQWKFVYKISNSHAFEFFFDVSQKALCEKAMRKSIMEYNPDVVVSVHPMMTNVPVLCCHKISEITGRHLPIFTVVTDLGSAHCLWFCNGVDKMFIASDQIRDLAKARGKVPDEKLVQIGLPIRHSFAEQADLLGDRMSQEGIQYQQTLRGELGLPVVDKKTVLVMGGGEGVGSLSNIVNVLYVEFVQRGIDALILVVCGRNEKLKEDLEIRNWDAVVKDYLEAKERGVRSIKDFALSSCVSASGTSSFSGKMVPHHGVGCMDGSVTQQIKKILSSSSLNKLSKENAMGNPELLTSDDDSNIVYHQSSADGQSLPPMTEVDEAEQKDTDEKREEDAETDEDMKDALSSRKLQETSKEIYAKEKSWTTMSAKKGEVHVVGLGFVTKMAEYMVATDVLVSKAGPGTIAEAASLSLPVMLTSFLPGQEEGNVDFVVDGSFGSYISDADPIGVAEEVGDWLTDEEKAKELSQNAKQHGAPHAARDIVRQIGDISLKWKKINDDRAELEKAAQKLKLGIPSQDEDDEEKDGRKVVTADTS